VRRVRALVWCGSLVLLSRSPGALVVVPGLSVLRGPLGLVLLGLGLAVALAPLGGGGFSPPSPRRLFGLSTLAFLSVGLFYTSRVQPSGDEPHYLIMAQSLWRERDLDLRDNFARGDYREFIPGTRNLEPHYGAPRADGRPFPTHSPGLPLLLAPAYALGGRAGCVIAFAFMASALGLVVRSLALLETGDPRAAFWAWAAAVGPPLAFYSFHLYTEVPSALALGFALVLLLGSPTAFRAFLAALLASALPWFHVKMIPAAAVLGLLALVRLRGRPRGVFAAAAGVMAVAYMGYYYSVFHHPTPLAIYGGVPRDMSGSPWRALPGIFLDRSFGLFPYAPVFLVAFAGFPFLKGRAQVFVGLAVLGPLLFWRMWWGGQCPPGRFLVPLLPLLGTALAARAAAGPKGLVRWRAGLIGLGLALFLFMVWRPEERLLLNHSDRPTRVWSALSEPLGRYLPSLVSGDPSELKVALVWVVALSVLLILDWRARRTEAVDRLFRGVGLPLVLLLLAGEAVDYWARPEEAERAPGVSSRGGAARVPSPEHPRTDRRG
jgi:hypothetical protein